MGIPAKKPEFQTVTIKAKSKKRVSVVLDEALLNLMKVVGKEIQGSPQSKAEKGEILVGIFVLPTNNVVEIYRTSGGPEKGHVFANLDVWMNYRDGAA